MNNLEVSVVMGVFNEQERLDTTIDSILSQQHVNFELIIVNDGSTDKTESIIHKYAHDNPRIKYINQPKQGLTKALITGCESASANIIARHDAGDISLPLRLRTQLDHLRETPGAVMCSCGVSFLAPDGEEFNHTVQSIDSALNGLKGSELVSLEGPPHHGSVVFDKKLYQKVGGYRKQFYVAQDIDLWTRMVEHGNHVSVQKILYKARANINSISSLKREQQIQTAKMILKCCEARSATGSDQSIVDSIRSSSAEHATNKSELTQLNSDFYYFIGASLLKDNTSAGIKYLQKAISINPYHWKARLHLWKISILRGS